MALTLAAVILPTGTTRAQTGPPSNTYVQQVADDVSPIVTDADRAERMRAMAALAPGTAAVIATSDMFPDAMTSGILQSDAMLLGTDDGALPASAIALLSEAAVDDITILGGIAAVPDAVRDQLPSGAEVRRISGAERTETAARIALGTADRPSTVLIARARGPQDNPSAGFIDAIGAGAWSAVTGWPILLVDRTASAATREALAALDPDDLVVIGGTAAVSDAAAMDLADGRPLRRIAGPERFTTAAAVAMAATGGQAATVLLLDGTDPDAWSTGFAAARLAVTEDTAILLTDGVTVPVATAAALADLAPDTLRCAAPSEACARARTDAGLPDATPVAVDPAPGTPLAVGEAVTVTADAEATVTAPDGCLADGRRRGDVAADCTATVRVDATTTTVGQTLTVTWPALRIDADVLQAPDEYTAPQAGGRWDFDDTVDTRPDADRQASRGAFVDTDASTLTYPQAGSVPVLWAGYGGAARVAPDGLAVPVDSRRHTHLIARIHTPAGGTLGLEWRSCPDTASSNCIEAAQIISRGTVDRPLAAGWQTVHVDLSTTPSWTDNPIHTLYVGGPDGMRIDDLRLSDGTRPAPADVTVAPGVTVVWDTNADPTDNTEPTAASWGMLGDNQMDPTVLPPGTYWLHTTTDGPDRAGSTTGPITIRPGGPTALTGPAPVEYGRDVRGNAFDFAAGTLAAGTDDATALGNATRVDGPGLTAVNANGTGDPFVQLDLPVPIDTTTFTHVTLTMSVDGPFDLGFGPGGGTLARIIWTRQGSGDLQDSNDIVIYPGQTRYTVDMTDPLSREPGTAPWQSGPVSSVRIDPNEDPAAGRRWTIESVEFTAGPPVG